ncbi:hypothetical protein LQV05_001677 [Cryptococcus neoformans]|nr:hypothetical protein LQV05_001677 [Cryptococcus neoformans]
MSEHSPTSQNNSVDLDAPPPSYWSPVSNRATVLENNNPYSAYPDAELVGTRQGDSTELMTRGRMRGRSGIGPSTSSWLQNISMSSNDNANAPISSKDDDPDLPWYQTTGINFGSDPTVIEIGPSQSNRRQRRRRRPSTTTIVASSVVTVILIAAATGLIVPRVQKLHSERSHRNG